MILNARQYGITKTQAEKFRAAISKAEASPPRPGPHAKERRALELAGLRAQLADLEREIRLYEDLAAGKKASAMNGQLEELGMLLIQTRVARGWSQRHLADRLGVQMQQIQRYEATRYQSADLARLVEIAQALAVTIGVNVSVLEIPDLKAFTAARRKVAGAR
ncbi:MAG: helix-turn-helix transcriptional regulator [Acidobacteriota bacterium]